MLSYGTAGWAGSSSAIYRSGGRVNPCLGSAADRSMTSLLWVRWNAWSYPTLCRERLWPDLHPSLDDLRLLNLRLSCRYAPPFSALICQVPFQLS
jgi:hypothetical protein